MSESVTCSYCVKPAVYRLYHRDGSENFICHACEKPETVRSVAKLGLEFKNDNTFPARIV